jgi:tetratricopeptide (TPR) repeat protein
MSTVLSEQLAMVCRLAADQAAHWTDIDLLSSGQTIAAALHHIVSLVELRPSAIVDGLNQLPQRPDLILDRLGLVLNEYLVTACREAGSHVALTVALNGLAARLREGGRPDAALVAAEEAIGLQRTLVESQPENLEAQRDLATYLSTVANCHTGQHRYIEALRAGEEALGLYRQVARADSVDDQTGIAIILNTLSIVHEKLGHLDEALDAAQDATASLRALAIDDPEARISLGSSLTNLSVILERLGHDVEALATAQEVVETRRQLAADYPTAFEPLYASALTNLSGRLARHGQNEEAAEAALAGLRLTRRLVVMDPTVYTPRLAVSLNNAASALFEIGRQIEALSLQHEAVEVRRDLARANHEVHGADLARALMNLSRHLSQHGRAEEAHQTAQEAHAILGSLAKDTPDVHREMLLASERLLAHLEAVDSENA